MQIARYINETRSSATSRRTPTPKLLQLTLTAEDPATMDAIEKEVLATFNDFSKVSRDGGEARARPRTTPRSTASARRRWIRRCSSSAAASTSGAWPRWTCASWAPTPSRSRSPAATIPEQAKELVGTTAQLEFRMVDDTAELLPDHAAADAAARGQQHHPEHGRGLPPAAGPQPRGAPGVREGQDAQGPRGAARVRGERHQGGRVRQLPHATWWRRTCRSRARASRARTPRSASSTSPR